LCSYCRRRRGQAKANTDYRQPGRLGISCKLLAGRRIKPRLRGGQGGPVATLEMGLQPKNTKQAGGQQAHILMKLDQGQIGAGGLEAEVGIAIKAAVGERHVKSPGWYRCRGTIQGPG